MPTPAWFNIALKEIGQKEIRGGENPRIIEYHATTTLKGKEDEIPWCSSAVNWCMIQAGYKGTNSAAAKSWLTWGEELTEPREGCICVIQQRKIGADKSTGSASGFHVGFWVNEDRDWLTLLGGNQGDMFKVSMFRTTSYNIRSYRWPSEGDKA